MEDESELDVMQPLVEEDTQIVEEYDDEIPDSELIEVEEDESPLHSEAVEESSSNKKIKQNDDSNSIRKPQSKWLMFLSANRENIRKENPSFNFKEIANALAEKYRNLTPEESLALDKAAAEDKERYVREIEEYNQSHIGIPSSVTKSSDHGISLAFPLAKVKRIAKYDPDVENIGKESLISICKAAELFVGLLALKSASTASLRGARTIKDTDVIMTMHSNEVFNFLKIDFPKPVIVPKTTVSKPRVVVNKPTKVVNKGVEGSDGMASTTVGKGRGRPSNNTQVATSNVSGLESSKRLMSSFITGKRTMEENVDDAVMHSSTFEGIGQQEDVVVNSNAAQDDQNDINDEGDDVDEGEVVDSELHESDEVEVEFGADVYSESVTYGDNE